MSSVIKVLDKSTADKIAAGEVIERPAAVVKELVENSIDAGSSSIEVEISNGGLTFIRVTDDGIAMNPEDAKLSVQRHATSKIASADDLEKLYTLGFRGEALPSIASVSKFTLTTRQKQDDFATHLEIEGGEIKDIREAGSVPGTTIIVQDLFFNLPARRKFLKSSSAESSYISEVIGKLALSHPEISFRLINNKKVTISTNGSGDLLDAIACLYGDDVKDKMYPILSSDNNEEIKVTGFVGNPTLLKSNRNWQTFIVNERIITSKLLFKAVDNSYFSLLPKGGHPLIVLIISLDPSVIDVNVHPQKREIKFSNDQLIFKAVYKAIANTLDFPVLDKSTSYTPDIEHVKVQTNIQQYKKPVTYDFSKNKPEKDIMEQQSFFQSSSFTIKEDVVTLSEVQEELSNLEVLNEKEIIQEENIISSSDNTVISSATEENDDEIHIEEIKEDLYPLGQIDNCYIVAYNKNGSGLYIIDQHAAHERILYERFKRNMGIVMPQQLLIPVFIDFPASDFQLLEDNKELFESLGFSFEQAGPTTMRLIEMPADIKEGEIETIIRKILSYIDNMSEPTAEMLRHEYLQIASCRSAIKAGDTLNMRQMCALLDALREENLSYTCPHGRPTTINFTLPQLDKLFKRT
ncbi:DNA mismatch repair endonuclease MutL [Selenomonadales bacterium OttesenSCG-928-I06]|nr:DNA mismatch repair endonuclease MutL [Selenomonadales bacterium OttesenSCG-928-I06]